MAALSPAATLLADLARSGLELRPDGNRLLYRPRSAMTPDLAERVKAHKPVLLALLLVEKIKALFPKAELIGLVPIVDGVRPDDLPAVWRELYEERAAIRHFDGGQALEHAEAEALREVVAMVTAAGGRM